MEFVVPVTSLFLTSLIVLYILPPPIPQLLTIGKMSHVIHTQHSSSGPQFHDS